MRERLTQDEFYARYVKPFQDVAYLFYKDEGFIVWRLGTGENVELLHIRAFYRGTGSGRKLVYRMLDHLRDRPPYYSVFGFTRVSNEEAKRFYGALGFNLQPVQGLYRDGQAIMFWQSFQELLRAKEAHENYLRG